MKLIECVPNFSEGRNQAAIDAIAAAIASVSGVELLDVDPGADTNRTVITFVGAPTAVGEAAVAAIAKAAQLIDMRNHAGVHPRMGATDVCPFVPVEGVTMDGCVDLAREVAARVGEELGIPVYLYGQAAVGGHRSLANVRRGEYEGLADRPDRPDFGPDLNLTAGATAIGAREFLIAYNVNLNTTDRKLAHQVAQAVRELGTPQRDAHGSIVKDAQGRTLYNPGRLRECKAVGWYLRDHGLTQVSMNLTDYRTTPIHAAFDACREEAAARGLSVTGSEIVGLVPRAALLAAGDHYLARQGRTTGLPEAERIRMAVMSLGLDELAPFNPTRKVVEYRVGPGGGGIATSAIADFLDELSSGSPTPGGGSVAALCGALAGALTSMVASLTHGKSGWEDSKPAMEELGRQSQRLKDWFLGVADRDREAFDSVLSARRLPKRTEDEINARRVATAEANLEATLVPLAVLEKAVDALELALTATSGYPNSVSDAGVAGACAEAAARSASLNVRINLPGLPEEEQPAIRQRHDAALDRAMGLAGEVARRVDGVLDADV